MDRVFVGKVVNTHGIKGEFRIKSDFEQKEKVFVLGNKIIIADKVYEIASYRVHKGYDMITVCGLNDINQVLPFKGCNAYVERDTLNLNENEYILEDLIDASVICNGEVLGSVRDFMGGVNPLLIIGSKKDFYIPINGNFIISYDKATHKLYVSSDTKGLMI